MLDPSRQISAFSSALNSGRSSTGLIDHRYSLPRTCKLDAQLVGNFLKRCDTSEKHLRAPARMKVKMVSNKTLSTNTLIKPSFKIKTHTTSSRVIEDSYDVCPGGTSTTTKRSSLPILSQSRPTILGTPSLGRVVEQESSKAKQAPI